MMQFAFDFEVLHYLFLDMTHFTQTSCLFYDPMKIFALMSELRVNVERKLQHLLCGSDVLLHIKPKSKLYNLVPHSHNIVSIVYWPLQYYESSKAICYLFM